MKIRNNNPLDLIVVPNETITISIVRSTGLAESVNYSLDGANFPGTKPKNEPCVFPVTKNGNLAMTMHYVANDGGSFSVKTTGDRGGDVSEFSGSQPTGATFRTIGFRLTVQAGN
jgi:hypothetical protein